VDDRRILGGGPRTGRCADPDPQLRRAEFEAWRAALARQRQELGAGGTVAAHEDTAPDGVTRMTAETGGLILIGLAADIYPGDAPEEETR
jgi:hypothetical protein